MNLFEKVLGVAAVLVAGAGGIGWLEVWGPESSADEVGDVLSGRSYDVNLLSDSIPDQIRKTVMNLKEKVGLLDRVHDSHWATSELLSLARNHPAALAHSSARQKSPEVRFAFLDAIEDSPAYASEVPPSIQVEHAASHAVTRMDQSSGKPLTAAERHALASAKEAALPTLRALLVHGHCGALAGYEVLGVKPRADELGAATRAVATAGADPGSSLTPAVQDNCRSRLAGMMAPTTDGGFGVTR